MAKSNAAKGCIFVGILLLLAAASILIWWFVDGQDDGSQSNKNINSEGNTLDSAFEDAKNEEASEKTDASDPVVITTAAPTAMPTSVPYPFYQCKEDPSNNNSSVTCCNGLNNICDFPVNEILFGALHNAMATAADNFLLPNHNRPVREALEAGFRGINVDVCNCLGEYQLCHGVCGLGQVNPVALIGDITSFLDENPNEVVLLTMELNSNAGEEVDLDEFNTTVLSQVEGFHDFLYSRENRNDPWPTLRELIEQDERLLVFHLNGPDCQIDEEGEGSLCPDGMHYYFEYFQETEFEFDSVDALKDVGTSCLVTRGATSSTGVFFAVNNFVTSSTADAFSTDVEATAAEVNALDFANRRIKKCAALIQEGPYRGEGDVNVMYVDYWSIGDIVQVVQEHNQNLGLYSERR